MTTPTQSPFRCPLPPRPPSSYAIGAGLNRRRLLGNIKWNLLRDNFELSTWLCLGASFQILLSYLPIPLVAATTPALILLLFKITWTGLIWLGIVPNPRARVVLGPELLSVPKGAVMGEHGERRAEFAALPGNEEVCVVMIAAQCRHPLGQLAPDYQFDASTDLMVRNLEADAETNGFLGATSWLNTSQFTSNNTMMTILYFRSKKDVDNFHKSKIHMQASSWFKKLNISGKRYVGLYQENYVSGKEQWDTFSSGFRPCMFDATTFLVEDDDGKRRWEGASVKLLKPGTNEYANRKKMFNNEKRLGSEEKTEKPERMAILKTELKFENEMTIT